MCSRHWAAQCCCCGYNMRSNEITTLSRCALHTNQNHIKSNSSLLSYRVWARKVISTSVLGCCFKVSVLLDYGVQLGQIRENPPNNLFVTSKKPNSPIHEFKVLQNVFKIKKQGLKCFFKVINKK